MDILECDTSEGLVHKMKKRKLEQSYNVSEDIDNNMGNVHSGSEDASSMDNFPSENDPAPDAMFIRCSKLESETRQTHPEICNPEANVHEKEPDGDQKLLKDMDTEHENINNYGNLILNTADGQCFDHASEEANIVNVYCGYEDVSSIDSILSENNSAPYAVLIKCSQLESGTGQTHPETYNPEEDVHEKERDVDQKLLKDIDTDHENINGYGNPILNIANVTQNVAKFSVKMEEPSSTNAYKEDPRISKDSGDMRDHDDHGNVANVAQELSKEMIDVRKDDHSIANKERITSTPSAMPPELENVGTVKPEVVCFSAFGETSSGVDANTEEKASLQVLDTSGKGKKLLVLDVNGLLADFICYVPYGFKPDIIIGQKAVFKRPFCDDFLKFCFERFEVGVWSSRTRRNVDMVIDFLMRDFREKLLFCWVKRRFFCKKSQTFFYLIGSYLPSDRTIPMSTFMDLKVCIEHDQLEHSSLVKTMLSINRFEHISDNFLEFFSDFPKWHHCNSDQSHCTDTSFSTVENKAKPLVLKEIRKLWKYLKPREFNASNTLLLDDSPHKALCNPANTAIFPVTYRFRDTDDTALGPGGDLRVYLEGLSMAENVQKHVEQNRFGQRPITERNPSWKFYRRIIYFVERQNDLDSTNSFK